MQPAKILPKSAFPGWIDFLKRSYTVVGPKAMHGQTVFGEIETADDLTLEYNQSVIPPKKYLVPQREVLIEYKLDGTEVEAKFNEEATVVFGVHTCDLHAIKLLDLIFSKGFTDQHYAAHRDNTIIIGYECLTTCGPESFCRSMGTASAPESAYDLHIIDMGSDYFIQIGTERGEALFTGYDGVFTATEPDYARMNGTLSDKWQRFPYRLDVDVTEIPDLLAESYHSDHWQELADICLACGMCTQVCPTCYCFDIRDEVDVTLSVGKRVRSWDSCQIDSFALVAGGHNFRETRAARQRHRFMRKGKYQFDATGMVGCVGCGRCATACLVDITPIKTFNELYRRQQQQPEEVEA
ncbi:MAG: hypothetical protein GYB64_12885 [Chloroflexi bacterium]|nr:hypothetical protein [Chloroflexota bacterium]